MSDVTAAAPASAAEAPSSQTAPTEAQQPSTPATNEPPRRLTQAERKAQLVERLRQGKERKAAERQASAPEQPAQTASESQEPAEAADDTKPSDAKPRAEEKKEPDRELELRVAKLARELRDAKADAIEFKPKAEKLDALLGKFEKAKGDPYAAVNLLPELFGMDFGQMADFVIKNQDKFQESKRYADLPPDLREEVEAAKRERQERAEREKQEAERERVKQRFTAYETKVKSFLEQNADDYPLSAALDWAAGDVAHNCLQRNTKDALPVVRELEGTLRKNLSGAISNERVFKALIADKELRTKIESHFKATQPKPNNSPLSGASLQNGAPEQRNGSATLTNRSTSSDTAAPQSGRPSRDQRKQQIMEAFKAANFTRR